MVEHYSPSCFYLRGTAVVRLTKFYVQLFAVVALAVANTPLLHAQSTNERERVAAVTLPTSDFTKPESYERRPGGATTVFKLNNKDAFSHPSANMSFERQLDFAVGNGIFRKIWVSSPSSTVSSDGLGPLFNARSCQGCHIKDGRGRPPNPGERAVSLLIRLSIPAQNDEHQVALSQYRKSVIPDPVYGGQLQNYSVQEVPAEGKINITYKEEKIKLADKSVVTLRTPNYQITNLLYGDFHPDIRLSPRVAPQMIGMGLLEAIPEDDILALEDESDLDGDGISGRSNWVWSDEDNKVALGRFGWKAGQPTVAQQSAGAFLGDIGISTPLYSTPYGECTEKQTECRNAPHGNAPEANGAEAEKTIFDLAVFYSRNLGVPARRDIDDPKVLEGKRLFYEANCVGCHNPKFVTRRDSIGEEQSFQLIWPYTDMLLHDMGEGLADNRAEAVATGREWRTAPLWGIGLTETVSKHTLFLHDGRARNLLEAILWHGGEAEASKQKVVNMTRDERDALLAFLRSL